MSAPQTDKDGNPAPLQTVPTKELVALVKWAHEQAFMEAESDALWKEIWPPMRDHFHKAVPPQLSPKGLETAKAIAEAREQAEKEKDAEDDGEDDKTSPPTEDIMDDEYFRDGFEEYIKGRGAHLVEGGITLKDFAHAARRGLAMPTAPKHVTPPGNHRIREMQIWRDSPAENED